MKNVHEGDWRMHCILVIRCCLNFFPFFFVSNAIWHVLTLSIWKRYCRNASYYPHIAHMMISLLCTDFHIKLVWIFNIYVVFLIRSLSSHLISSSKVILGFPTKQKQEHSAPKFKTLPHRTQPIYLTTSRPIFPLYFHIKKSMQVMQDRSPQGQYRKNQKAKLWGIEHNIYQKWEKASTLHSVSG